MNREFDREIDALLRRHTRATVRGRVLDDEGAAHSPQSEHLDADELNAFAENALPASARSLYVSHLADCADCRHAAAGLARTSNVAVESEQKAAAVHLKSSESAARVGWLSALFAPRVLRYAFPALALCLVGVIAFVALRSTSQQDAGQLAQHKEQPEAGEERTKITQEAPASQSSGIVAPDGATQNANVAGGAGGAASHESAQPASPVQSQPGRDDAPDGSTATGPAPTSAAPVTAAPPPPPPSADTQETVVVEAAPPAPKSVSKDKTEDAKVGEVAAREQQANSNFRYSQGQNQMEARGGQPRKVDIDQMPDGSRNTQRSEPQQQAGGRAANNLPMLSRPQTEAERGAATATRRAPRAAAPRDRREDEEETKEVETTNVSGHRFRRQGGVWVDLKYSTSQKTTGVRRGSDAYRGLVADIPELGRIAEQLKGEIIVVVKGRAYRIL